MMGQYQYICLLNQYEHNDIREEIKFIYLKGIRKSPVPTSKEINWNSLKFTENGRMMVREMHDGR